MNDWTIHNDRQSVTVGINTRLWLCRRQGLVPVLIRLGRKHTWLLMKEHGLLCIPNRRFETPAGLLKWDPDLRQILYGPLKVPVRFNDPRIYGIAVEGRSRSTE